MKIGRHSAEPLKLHSRTSTLTSTGETLIVVLSSVTADVLDSGL